MGLYVFVLETSSNINWLMYACTLGINNGITIINI